MATRIGPNGVCEYLETNTYDKDGTSASIIDIINDNRNTLFFRGITAGTGITVDLVDVAYPNGLGYSVGKTIQINSTGGGSNTPVTVTDAGSTGTSIIGSEGVVNNSIPFRTIAVSGGLQLAENNDVITISTEEGLGAKWYVITTETPDNTVGNDGDMLVNNVGEIFNKVSGAWVDSTINIKGPEGLGITNRGNFATGVQYNVNDIIINPVNGLYGGSVFIVTKDFDSTNTTLSQAEQAGDVQLLVENGARGSLWYYGPGTDHASIIAYAEANNTSVLAAAAGDYYLSSDNYTVFELLETTDNWTSTGIVLKGATGGTGPQGPAGIGLENKGDWVSGTTYVSGDYVFAKTSDTDSTTSMFIYKGDGSTASTVEPADDTTNWVEFTAPSGQRGSLWTVASTADAPTNVANAQINDQYLTNTGIIYTLTAIGTDGTQTWTAGPSIVGPKGDVGPSGKDGTNGVDGKDGISPTISIGTTTTEEAGTDASVTVDSTSTTSNTILNFSIPQGIAGKDGTNGTNGKDGAKWFYNKTATDGTSIKSDGGNVGDYCLIGTGEIYTLTSIDSSGNETWTDSGINITGPSGTNGTDGSKWYIGTITSPSISTIPSDPILNGVTLNPNDTYLGQDLYVYTYNGTAWTKSTTYLGSSSGGNIVEFDSTGTSLGTVSNNTATVYSITGGSGISITSGSNEITISTTGSSISAEVGSVLTTGITTLVQGSNITFDTSTKGSLEISSTGSSGSTTLQGLSDVSSSNPQTGNILQYNSGSSKWVAVAPQFTLAANLSDAQITSPSNGQIIQYNSTDSKWENVNLSVSVDNINGILSVAKGGTGQSSFTTNGVLIGNGTNAVGVTSAPSTAGEVLSWDGSEFNWTVPSGSGGSNTQLYAIAIGYSGNADGGCTAMALPTGWTVATQPSASTPQTSSTITTNLSDDAIITWMCCVETSTAPTAYTGTMTISGKNITLQVDSGTTGFNNTSGKGYIILTVGTGFPTLS